MPSAKLATIRARWAEARNSLDKPKLTQARQDIRELIGMVEHSEDLLDTLYDRDQTSRSPQGVVRDVGQDVWMDDVTTARSALEEVRTALANSLDWHPPQ
jgi:hypothetical protein